MRCCPEGPVTNGCCVWQIFPCCIDSCTNFCSASVNQCLQYYYAIFVEWKFCLILTDLLGCLVKIAISTLALFRSIKMSPPKCFGFEGSCFTEQIYLPTKAMDLYSFRCAQNWWSLLENHDAVVSFWIHMSRVETSRQGLIVLHLLDKRHWNENEMKF